VRSTDILKPLTGLISSTLVNNVEYRFSVDVEDIDDYQVVKIDVVSQIKLKTTRGSTVFLAVLIVFRKVFECSSVNVVTSLFKHVLQSTY
jgi:hypothetical protein